MSELKMGSAPNSRYLVLVIAGTIVAGGIAYYATTADSDAVPAAVASADAEPDTTAAAGTLAAPAPSAATPASPEASDTATAAATAALESSAQSRPAATPPTAAETPAQEPAQMEAPAMAAVATTAPAFPSAEVDTQPTQQHSRAEDAPRAPVAPPRPPAYVALREWWKTDDNSGLAVEHVGQAAEAHAVVVVFSRPVDAATLSDRLKISDTSGAFLDGSWERGRNAYVAVRRDLEPGRYTVLIDDQARSQQGEILGSDLRGTIFVQ